MKRTSLSFLIHLSLCSFHPVVASLLTTAFSPPRTKMAGQNGLQLDLIQITEVNGKVSI